MTYYWLLIVVAVIIAVLVIIDNHSSGMDVPLNQPIVAIVNKETTRNLGVHQDKPNY